MATEATTDGEATTVNYTTDFSLLRGDTRQLLISLVDMPGVRHVHAIGGGSFDRLCVEIDGDACIKQSLLPDDASITRVRSLSFLVLHVDVRGDD
jgi:hypothetical protein